MKAHEQIIAPGAEEGWAYADDGFFFGIGAFETIAVSGQTPLFLDEHLTRMEETLKFFGIEAAHADLQALALRACAELDPTGEWALKLTVAKRNRIASTRRNPYASPNAKRAFSCDFSTVRRNESSPLARMKTLAYAENIIEKRRARERGIDEPLFLNTHGEVAEGAVSNIFAVIAGEVVTPPRFLRIAARHHASACDRPDGGYRAPLHAVRVGNSQRGVPHQLAYGRHARYPPWGNQIRTGARVAYGEPSLCREEAPPKEGRREKKRQACEADR